MLSQVEQACKTYSTESSIGLIEFDINWQCYRPDISFVSSNNSQVRRNVCDSMYFVCLQSFVNLSETLHPICSWSVAVHVTLGFCSDILLPFHALRT